MTSGAKTLIFPVDDLAAAKALFRELLGAEPYMDEPYYVGFEVAGQNVGLDPNASADGVDGPVAYWHVDDIAEMLARMTGAGAEVVREVKDVGGGKLIAAVRDGSGNVIGVLQPAARP